MACAQILIQIGQQVSHAVGKVQDRVRLQAQQIDQGVWLRTWERVTDPRMERVWTAVANQVWGSVVNLTEEQGER